MTRKFVILALTVFSAIALTGCGGKAKANLRFATSGASTPLMSASNVGAFTTYAASTFKMKLIAAYLTEDIDPVTQNNVGGTEMIWLNPICGDDIMHCDISAGTAEDGAPMSHIVTDFFDFSNNTLANAALNSQDREISAGNYKYARLEFCKYNSGNSQNIKWASTAASVSSEQAFQRNNCTVNSAVFSPAIDVKAKDTVTITLTYDISTAVDDSGGSSSNCSGGKCFNLPSFAPSATKN